LKILGKGKMSVLTREKIGSLKEKEKKRDPQGGPTKVLPGKVIDGSKICV